MTPVELLIKRKKAQLQSDCELAIQKVRRATTILDVVRASRLTIPAELRRGFGVMPEVSQLSREASNKLEFILESQICEIKNAEVGSARKNLYGKLMQEQWQFLRGVYPAVFLSAERQGLKLVHSLV